MNDLTTMPSSSLTPNTAVQRPTVPELHDLDDTGLDSPVSCNSGTVGRCIAVFGVKLDDGMDVRSSMREFWL